MRVTSDAPIEAGVAYHEVHIKAESESDVTG